MATVTINTSVSRRTQEGALGIGLSTYGHSIVRVSEQRDALRRHGNVAYRLPIQWNNGNPISSARGGPSDISADEWVDQIHNIGGKVYMQIGGKDFDCDFNENDAAGLVRRYAPRGVTWFGVGNEPNNGGWNVEQTIDLFNRCAPAMRQASAEVGVPIKIGGLVWSYYDRGRNQQFLDQCGGQVDFLEYHHYSMGNPPAQSDQEALGNTPDWGRECREIYEDARARGHDHVVPCVGEANWAWQYKDGWDGSGDGSDLRFFQPIITAWMASIIGHGLWEGGLVWQYSDQNGPLGITVEGGNSDQGKPSNTPQPVYHGVGAWTGEGKFPSAACPGEIYETSTDDDGLEAFAIENIDGGINVIVINKTTDRDIDVSISAPIGTAYTAWLSNRDDPYADLGSKGAGELPPTVEFTVPPCGVGVVSTETVSEGSGGTPPEPPVTNEPLEVYWHEVHSDLPGVDGTTVALGDPVSVNAGTGAKGVWKDPANSNVTGGTVAQNPPLGVPVSLGDGETVEGLFDDEMWGPQEWVAQLPSGADGATLSLMFMERFAGAQVAGGRPFTIEASLGDRVLVFENVDVFAGAGKNPAGAVLHIVPDNIGDSTVRLKLSVGHSNQNPFLNGIRVQPLAVEHKPGGGGGSEDDLFTHLPLTASQADIINKINGILDFIKPE